MGITARSDAAMPNLPLVEHRLEDPATGIYGTPDRVELIHGRLRVVDLKSGLHQQDATDNQRRQLLLYAHLVKATLGQAPDDLVIIDIGGRKTYVAFDTSDMAEAVRVAQRARDAWNSGISSRQPPYSLAAPGPSACRWCPFRVTCRPSWETWAPEWSYRLPPRVSSATLASPKVKYGWYRNSPRLWPTKPSASSASQSPVSRPETTW